MGTFSGGYMLDPATGRPVVGRTVTVTSWPDEVPLTPDDGAIATGPDGGYGIFTVADHDAVQLRAGDVEQVLVSVERQLEKIDVAGVQTVNGQSPDASGNVTIEAGGVDIQVGGPQPDSGWWLDTGQPLPVDTVAPTPPTLTVDNTAQTLLVATVAGGTDNVAVTSYRARIDGGTWQTTTGIQTFTSLAAGSTHTIDAQAGDAAGNWSTSTTWTGTTAPPTPPTIIDTFTRTVSPGLGTSDSGHTWTRIAGSGTSVDGSKAVVNTGSQYITPELSTWNLDISAEVGLGTASPSGGQGACIYIGDAANYLRVHRDPSGAIRVALNNDGFNHSFASRGTGLDVVGTLRMVLDSADGMNGTLTLFDGATQLGDPIALAMTNPLPKQIFLGGTGSGTYTFDNFTVTEFI